MPDQYSARERAAAEAMKPMVGQPLDWCLPIARVALRAADSADTDRAASFTAAAMLAIFVLWVWGMAWVVIGVL